LDSFGISQAANHTHCVFPSSQQAQLTAFVNKFLVGTSANTTNVVNTAGTGANYSFTTPGTWDPWAAPVLAPVLPTPRPAGHNAEVSGKWR
jgi:hypothetical protein